MIASHYIANPLLINGYKFDLRIYVAITSINPLKIYKYKKGLVRLAGYKYSNKGEFKNLKHMHLTNFALAKQTIKRNSSSSDKW